MIDPLPVGTGFSCSGRGRRFLGRLVDLVHDGGEGAMAFDGVPIGIRDGVPENRRFCLACCRVSGCPGLENALDAVEKGIESSPAFVREPEGNGCVERFFRTLKEQLLWVRHFQSIPELVRALEEIRSLYNQHWLIERLGFEPPVQARQRLALQPAA